MAAVIDVETPKEVINVPAQKVTSCREILRSVKVEMFSFYYIKLRFTHFVTYILSYYILILILLFKVYNYIFVCFSE